jgi:hypothetical protein
MPLVGFEASVRAGEDGSCLRPLSHCDRPIFHLHGNIIQNASLFFSICLSSAVIVFNASQEVNNELVPLVIKTRLPDDWWV